MPDVREKIINALKTVYDPEIPVNIYDLGLVYDIDIAEGGVVTVKMTLTAPNCPEAENIPPAVESRVNCVSEVNDTIVELVWDPPWTPDRMSEAARLELGF
jgi:FeS assembly SUF system protein